MHLTSVYVSYHHPHSPSPSSSSPLLQPWPRNLEPLSVLSQSLLRPSWPPRLPQLKIFSFLSLLCYLYAYNFSVFFFVFYWMSSDWNSHRSFSMKSSINISQLSHADLAPVPMVCILFLSCTPLQCSVSLGMPSSFKTAHHIHAASFCSFLNLNCYSK